MNDGGIHVTPAPRSFERRMDYLDRVGEHLRMPDDRRDEVLEEIAAHLDDAIDALMDEGLSIEQAEREAMARLGSPAELGNDLRRTHQTTKRLLAAAGGGVWHGLEGAITGWIMAAFALIPVFWVILAIGQGVAVVMPRLAVDLDALMTSYSPGLACAAVWLAGRRMVRAVAERSWRREHQVRRQIATVGFVVLGTLVLLVPSDYTWLSVALSIGIPFAFAAGAISAGGREDGRPWVAMRWPSRFPSRRKVLWASVLVFVIGPMVLAVVGYAIVGAMPSQDIEMPPIGQEDPAPTGDPWTTGGYTAVASSRVLADEGAMFADYARDGWTVARLANDRVDWDAWPGLRLEAWKAASNQSRSYPDLLDPEAGPYLVVPVTDPWATPNVAVNVGRPGISGYALLLVAQDPATGARTVIGRPEGGQTVFHGSMLDWFAAR